AKISTASSAIQAIRIIEAAEEPFRVVITDQRMPNMTGTELLVKVLELSPESRRVLFTGYSELESAMVAVNQGAIHYYLTKPWDNETVLRVIRQELSNFEKERGKKELFSIIQNQNARYYKAVNALKQKDKRFQTEIRAKQKEIIRRKQSLSEMQTGRKEVIGLEKLLSRNVLMQPDCLVGAYDQLRKGIVDIFVTLSKHRSSEFVPNPGFDEKAFRDELYDITGDQFDLIDLIIGYAGQVMEPELFKSCGGYFEKIEREDSDTAPDFGQLLLKEDLITKAQLDQVLEELDRRGWNGSENVLVSELLALKYITPSDLSRIMLRKELASIRRKDKYLIDFLLKGDRVSKEKINQARIAQINRFEQSGECTSISDILLEFRALSSNEMQDILSLLSEAAQTPREDNTGDAGAPSAQDQLEISPDRTVAWLKTPPGQKALFSAEQVNDILDRWGISYGRLDEDRLKEALESSEHADGKIVVAQGDAPEPGTDAKVRYHFNAEYQRAGIVHADGTIDFKDRGTVPFVKAGALLAEKIPKQKGKPGKDVYGNTIHINEGDDSVFKAGRGTFISSDGRQIFAREDGQPYLDSMRTVVVVTEMRVSGNVDYKTGHINYEGNVFVTGSVQEGFEVNCFHLTANGINGGIVNAAAGVDISNGIVNAKIKAMGNVRAKYINRSTLDVMGDLNVVQEIMGSKIYSSGKCINTKGRITGSDLSAKKGFELCEVGTDRSRVTILRPGSQTHIERIGASLDEAIAEQNRRVGKEVKRYEEMERKLLALHKAVADHSAMQEKYEEELEALKKKRLESFKHKDAFELIKNDIKIKETAVNDITNKIKQIFQGQESLMSGMSDLDNRISAMKEEMAQVESQKADLKDVAALKRPVTIVEINKQASLGTRILGPNASMVLDKNQGACKIMEIKSQDPAEPGKWKMVIEPL
ncbi:MAG TPA: hypothetical protein DHV36_20425, partial [Desulfobacteraceae bacterium]|nr:hypothetical protein [Desulfobacteraceae bacterium]